MVSIVGTWAPRGQALVACAALVAAADGCNVEESTGVSATDGAATGVVVPSSTAGTSGDVVPTGGGTGGASGGETGSTGPAAPTTTASATTGPPDPCHDPDGGSDDPLCGLPGQEFDPTEKPDGLPSPLPGVYDDQGPAPPESGFRALIGFPTRDREGLELRVEALYDPLGADFRDYLSVQQWMDDHAPPSADLELVGAWLKKQGFVVTWTASNRLLLGFSGKAADFNATFNTELHICMRKNPLHGGDPFPVYCTLDSFTLPKFMADRTNGIVTADLPVEAGMPAKEVGQIAPDPPGDDAYGPPTIAGAYGLDALYAQGADGTGARIGVVVAGTYHAIDLQIFWASFGVTRALPTRVPLMEPPPERITEAQIDTTWSSSMAPGAEVLVYEGPDARNTALLFAFNAAIADGQVDVVTDSFAHREDSEAAPLRHQYDESALMAAALGITVVSASGDGGRPDTPCGSPYVTCVGGTTLDADAGGVIKSEVAWHLSGSGDSKSFPLPAWQAGLTDGETRATADVALNASPSRPYWIRRWGKWESYGGTSFAAPVMAAIVACVNGQRKQQGLPPVGFLNPAIYLDPAVRATFRDIKDGGTDKHPATEGWDYPTGVGAPHAADLAAALP